MQWRHGMATDEETAETVSVDPDLEDREDVKDGSGAYERTAVMHSANSKERNNYFQYLEEIAAGGTGVSMNESKGDGEQPVKRWTGRLVAPSAIPSVDMRMPESTLELDWVYGYRSHDCRSNVKYSADSRLILFHVAKVAVCYDKERHLQSFMNEHTDEIVSMAVHPSGKFCATGQVGKTPDVLVWTTDGDVGMKVVSKLSGESKYQRKWRERERERERCIYMESNCLNFSISITSSIKFCFIVHRLVLLLILKITLKTSFFFFFNIINIYFGSLFYQHTLLHYYQIYNFLFHYQVCIVVL